MSGATSIQWCHATWNPVRGCSRISPGCQNCYAEAQAGRFSGPGQPFNGFASRGVVAISTTNPETVGSRYTRWTGRVELVPDALDWPLRVGRPKWVREAEARGERPRVFVNSMSDLFHERLSDETIAAVLGVIAAKPELDFVVLTKRAARMRELLLKIQDDDKDLDRLVAATQNVMGWRAPGARRVAEAGWPLQNLWLGVSVEDQATADERIPHLLATPAAVRFVSYEPALGPVDFVRGGWSFLEPLTPPPGNRRGWNRGIDWLIFGGESGRGARPCDLAWARSAREQCKEAGVPFFFKQAGSAVTEPGCAPGHVWVGSNPSSLQRLRDRNGGDLEELPKDLHVRELPEVRR